MKGLAITNSGDVSLLEIKELIGAVGKKEKNAVVFDCDAKKLCDLCYFGRSVSRVMELLCSFEFKNLDDIGKKIKIENFSAETFAVKCIREGKHDFSSSDVEKIVGDKVDSKVDLKNPQNNREQTVGIENCVMKNVKSPADLAGLGLLVGLRSGDFFTSLVGQKSSGSGILKLLGQ